MAISKAISKQLRGNNVESDETYTPEYVVDFLDKHICHLKKTYTIWCPFSNNPKHAFVKRLTELGYKVKWNKSNNDFFAYDKDDVEKLKVDLIIDNPPFSIKDQVLAHSFALGLPFIYILPLDSLGGHIVMSYIVNIMPICKPLFPTLVYGIRREIAIIANRHRSTHFFLVMDYSSKTLYSTLSRVMKMIRDLMISKQGKYRYLI